MGSLWRAVLEPFSAFVLGSISDIESCRQFVSGLWLRPTGVDKSKQTFVALILTCSPHSSGGELLSFPGGRAPLRRKLKLLLPLAVVSLLAFTMKTQAQAPVVAGPNADPTYQQLRNISLGSEAVRIENVDLKRDAATFHLHSGNLCFVAPVNGKITGACSWAMATWCWSLPFQLRNPR
jgi:hypothetical protein